MYVVPKNGWYVKLTSNSCVLYVWRYVVNSLFDPVFQMSSIGTINMSFMHSISVHTCTVFVPSVSVCICVSKAEWAITATATPFVGHSEKWTFLRELYTIGILGFGGRSVSIKSILYTASQKC